MFQEYFKMNAQTGDYQPSNEWLLDKRLKWHPKAIELRAKFREVAKNS